MGGIRTMSIRPLYVEPDTVGSDTVNPDVTSVERSLIRDAAWLLRSVRDFCHYADPEAVAYLLDYSDDRLSALSLAHIAEVVARRLESTLEMP
jgi:hypothetical protein